MTDEKADELIKVLRGTNNLLRVIATILSINTEKISSLGHAHLMGIKAHKFRDFFRIDLREEEK